MAGQKVLMVEGKDDEHVLRSICSRRSIPFPDQVQLGPSVQELLEAIPTQIELMKAEHSEGDVVGIVIDADTNLSARWQSVRDRLVEVGYPYVPVAPDPNGTILNPPDGSFLPRAGVWIMPDNKTPGILEDFLDFLIPQSDALRTHAHCSVDSLPEQPFSDNDRPKALIHTWLAWQKDPGKPYGTAITARFLNPCLPQANVLALWLERLFDD